MLNPVRAGQYDDLVLAQPAQALFQRIVAFEPGVAVRTRRGRAPWPVAGRLRRRRGPRVAALGVLVSLSVAVAGYALVATQVSKPQTAACFAAADLRSTTAVVAVEDEGPSAACSRVWDEGYFGAQPRPALRDCVLASGVVGVFPQPAGRDVCLDLGLAAVTSPAASGPGSSARPHPVPNDSVVDPARFLAFRDAVARRLSEGCIGAGPAEAIVREELARAGLARWSVVVRIGADGTGFSAERPCATLNLLPEVSTVELVPLPPTG